jgi:hypothetical protein
MSDTFRIYSNLLAQEGIDLNYSAKVATASFDFSTRKITLPAFEYLDTISNQMMTAHEAGHALYSLYTLDQVKSLNRKYGSLFNILEDCYIEKEIKKSFPGLRQIFTDAYTSLFDNEFFGKVATDVSAADMKLVDRINIHFKLGHIINIEFLPEEKKYISQIYMLSSNEDVINLCKELKEFIKESRKEEEKTPEEKPMQNPQKQEEQDPSQGSLSEIGEDEEEKDSDDSNESSDESETDEEKDSGEESDEESDSGEESDNESAESSTGNDESDDIDDDLISDTDKAVKDNFDKLKTYSSSEIEIFKVANCSQYEHLCGSLLDFIPKFKMFLARKDNKFKPFLTAHATRVKTISNAAGSADAYFKMKLTAKNLSQSKLRKTGRIDSRTLVHYKTRDDIFKKMMVLPEQQNHGVIILLDASGSIQPSFSNIITQTAILGEFCKRNSIPFEIFLFGARAAGRDSKPVHKIADSLNFDLRTFLLFDITENRNKLKYKYRTEIPMWYFGETPMDAACVVAEERIAAFKSAGIEKTHLFLITDGDSIGSNVILDTDNGILHSYLSGRGMEGNCDPSRLIYKNQSIDISKYIGELSDFSDEIARSPFYIEKFLYYIKKKHQTKVTLCYCGNQDIPRTNYKIGRMKGKHYAYHGMNVLDNSLMCSNKDLTKMKQNNEIGYAKVDLPWMNNVIYFTDSAFKTGSSNNLPKFSITDDDHLKAISDHNKLRSALSLFIKELVMELA